MTVVVEQVVHRVVVEAVSTTVQVAVHEVEVVTAGVQGPPGSKGDPGDSAAFATELTAYYILAKT